MKGPDEKASAYSDKQWNTIKHIIKYIGLDADAVMVSGLPSDGDLIPPVTLRAKLEWHAQLSRGLAELFATMPTPKETAKLLAKKLDETKKYSRSFGTTLLDYGWRPSGILPDYPRVVESPSFKRRKALHERLYAVLSDIEGYLRGEIAEFTGAGSQSNQNAAKLAEKAYLQFLLELWTEIGGREPQRKLTINFLFACAAPLFPKMTQKAVEHWLDDRTHWPRYYPKRT
jgi:hypothetical protein